MRYAAGIEYDGSGFYGWQRQRQSPTVQACLEQALAGVADHPVTVHCAGRTDTGVHACAQVVHFDTTAQRPEHGWLMGTNSSLHEGISMLWLRAVDERFNARHSAASRHYRYRLLNRQVRPALLRNQVAWERQPLDAARMHAAGQALLGEHDFSAFRAAGCQSRTPVRRVLRLEVARSGDELIVDIVANAFVYHMVRNIVGTLIVVGRGEEPVDWPGRLLAARDRTLAGPTAPAQGLYFVGPSYPDWPQLPVPGLSKVAPGD